MVAFARPKIMRKEYRLVKWAPWCPCTSSGKFRIFELSEILLRYKGERVDKYLVTFILQRGSLERTLRYHTFTKQLHTSAIIYFNYLNVQSYFNNTFLCTFTAFKFITSVVFFLHFSNLQLHLRQLLFCLTFFFS